jgi:hypothetical protein
MYTLKYCTSLLFKKSFIGHYLANISCCRRLVQYIHTQPDPDPAFSEIGSESWSGTKSPGSATLHISNSDPRLTQLQKCCSSFDTVFNLSKLFVRQNCKLEIQHFFLHLLTLWISSYSRCSNLINTVFTVNSEVKKFNFSRLQV